MTKYDTGGGVRLKMRSRARLTITLSPDLLERIDQMIDKQTIRNRSHAIELLLRQSLQPRVSTAVLLAGGGKTVGDIPALSLIDGRTLISITVHHLREAGIRRVVVLAGKNGKAVREVMGDGDAHGVAIRYVSERRPKGTAGALKLIEPHLNGGSFLVIHGDVLTDIDIPGFIDFHVSENTLATVAVKPRRAEKNYGKVILQGNKIIEFFDQSESQGIGIVNTGVYLFKPEVLGLIDATASSRLETDVFPQLAELGELSAFFFQGTWYDISAPENYRLAQVRWKQKGGYRHARPN